MRCGREVWPPLPVSRTSSWSAAPVIGPSRTPDLAEVEGRVAVEAEDLVDLVEGAELDQRGRAAGHDLLGGLEQQAYAAGQLAAAVHLGQGEAGADQAGRVHVVPARVRDAGAGADPGVGGQVVDRERVEVGAQRHAAALAR